MSPDRLSDYLQHIQQAALDIRHFVEGLDKDAFLADKRTQQAVILNLIIMGEAATKIVDKHAAFVQSHQEVPWHSMRGMRNRMTHGYFDINLDVVWDTVQQDLPALQRQLQPLLQDLNKDLSQDVTRSHGQTR